MLPVFNAGTVLEYLAFFIFSSASELKVGLEFDQLSKDVLEVNVKLISDDSKFVGIYFLSKRLYR